MRIAQTALFTLTALIANAGEAEPAWAAAHKKAPMNAEETRAFMKKLAQFVFDNHLKKDEKSEQRGMIYEYFHAARKGLPDQFVQGEALDTMHDGAWFAAALVNAYRATGDTFYKEFLSQWVLPFYCKMLNHSDTLFSSKQNDARPESKPFNKEHAFQEGEKGFVPYWWDNGGSVSLEQTRSKKGGLSFPGTDLLAGQPNPEFRLKGYSHGSSNHLAQDLGVMLQLAWLLLNDSGSDADKKLADEVAEAAKSLHECRMRHHGHIPMCDAPLALARKDSGLLKFLPDQSNVAMTSGNRCFSVLYDFKPGERKSLPGFADDQQYRYYAAMARHGGQLPRAMMLKIVFDAQTEPQLFRCYWDNGELPPGINVFDLSPYYARDGKLEAYRSDGRPRPIGSRMGPQNMVCCGWALQALKANPGLWEEHIEKEFPKDIRVMLYHARPKEESKLKQTAFGTAAIGMVSTPVALMVGGGFKGNEAAFKIYAAPDAKGSYASVTMKSDKTFAAVNDKGELLVVKGGVEDGDEDSFIFRLEIPYTVVKEQKAWANGVEHGRYSLEAGGEVRNLYLMSSEDQARTMLERELGGGLRTWEAIFAEKGYIPTGINAGAGWDIFSDSGGYAHLVSACAQWLFYLQGNKDWEIHHVPAIKADGK